MISISDNDQKIISFLIRNYAGRYTTREIGLKLKISPAGAYKSLKKLEKENIVVPERLGTGLFYDINYRSTSAMFLACFVLSLTEKDSGQLKEHSRAVLRHGKSIVVITSHHDHDFVKSIASKQFKDADIIIFSDDDFGKKLLSKDPAAVEVMKDAEPIHGSEFIVRLLSRMIR